MFLTFVFVSRCPPLTLICCPQIFYPRASYPHSNSPNLRSRPLTCPTLRLSFSIRPQQHPLHPT